MESLFTPEQLAFLDSQYVKKNDCNDRHTKTEKEISEILIKQGIAETKLSFISKVDIASLTALLGIIIAKVCDVIFK